MRRMKNLKTGTVINVVKHIMLSNNWEYYVIDQKDYDTGETRSDEIIFCLVMGFETELGDVSISEIAPYIRSITSNLQELAPADGWEWVD